MNFKGSCALSIINSNFTNQEISSKLGVAATSEVSKGQIVSKVLNKKAKYNKWIFERTIQASVNETLNEIFELVESNLESYYEIEKKSESIELALYLRSDYGQIGFNMSKEIIHELSKLKVELDVHILSFGAVASD